MGPDDRYLRFGYIASDGHIGRYVDQLDFDHDEVFGVFNRRLDLVAMAHLAYLGSQYQDSSDQRRVRRFGAAQGPRPRHGLAPV